MERTRVSDVLVQLALRFLGLSLIAVGGANALVPAIHAQAVSNAHWIDERSFTG
jgi:chromate transport protein ChrA